LGGFRRAVVLQQLQDVLDRIDVPLIEISSGLGMPLDQLKYAFALLWSPHFARIR
jgi:hypothetical protein